MWFFAQSMCFCAFPDGADVCGAQRRPGDDALGLCGRLPPDRRAVFCLVLLAFVRRAWRAENPAQGLRVFLRRKLYWCAGPVLLAASYMALNFLRFGNVFEFGHNYLPEFVRAPQGSSACRIYRKTFSNLFRLPQWKGEELPLFKFPLTTAWRAGLRTRCCSR